MRPLNLDKQGNIVTKPVAGWQFHAVAESSVLLAIEYLDSPEQMRTMEGEMIQFVLTPPQCLELAEALTRSAKRILDEPMPPDFRPN
jgi:hypothetical protein